MLHLAYLGTGLAAILLVALVPALIPYLLELTAWWFGGRTEATPRLIKEYGSYWIAGLFIMLGIAGAYALGLGIFWLFHRFM